MSWYEQCNRKAKEVGKGEKGPEMLEKKKKRKDYAFQFNEKPSVTPGCPGEKKLAQA